MVLVDTSVWIDYFRQGEIALTTLLEKGDVLCHPFILGELACGHLHPRKEILRHLSTLPFSPAVRNQDVLEFMEMHRFFGLGLGLIDMHLLASATLAGASLWSGDKGLKKAAEKLRISF